MKIKSAFKEQDIPRFVQGTVFSKGDYLDRPTRYYAHGDDGKVYELSRTKILAHFPDRKNITDKLLGALKGQDVESFKNE